jgi:hypothetical protein
MKALTCILFLVLPAIAFAQTKTISTKYGTLEIQELDYGLASVEGREEIKVSNTPTKTRGVLEDFVIIKMTDSIQIAPKANFGVVYIVNAKDSIDIDVDIEWIYPKTIKNEQGEKFKSVRYTTKRPTNTASASSYSLDAPYEMVPGKWTENIYIENKLVLTRTFILYK